jgi:hypothetical protein
MLGIIRKLEDIHQDLARLAGQGTTVRFLTNTENAQRVNGLVEDTREAIMDYQVCMPNDSFLPRLMSVLGFTAARYL